jgi:hypothetical protein
MTGGIAEAFYKEISEEILVSAKKVIPLAFWGIWEEFRDRVGGVVKFSRNWEFF